MAISPDGSDSDGDGVNIFFDHSIQIDFTCRYSLATVDVSTDQNVSGVDQVYNREMTGSFSFSMVSYSFACYASHKTALFSNHYFKRKFLL